MREYSIKNISFGSYVKLLILSGFGMGFIMAICMLLLSFLDDVTVYVTFMDYKITGIGAGFLSFIVCPLLFAFIWFLFSIFLYLGFKIVMKFKKKIKVILSMEE